jgi:Ca2+-binding RTX toxin-like protein
MSSAGTGSRAARALAVAALAAAAALALAPGADARVSCGGKKATIVGTGGNDKIRVPGDGHGKQVVNGMGGNDTIITGKASDTICGGAGDDRLFAGKGSDRAFGGAGNDSIVNQKGRDQSYGEAGDDQLRGGPSKEASYGGAGNDVVDGSSDRDNLHGNSGDDLVLGDDGSDDMYGDDGNDILKGGSGGEDMFGGPGDDRLYGELLDDNLNGEGGNDVLIGSHGIDEMRGGSGDDWLRGGTNKDRYQGDDGTDTASFISAMPNEEFKSPLGVIVNLAAGTAQGPGGSDSLGGVENVLGSAFNDTLTGNGGANLLDGSAGDDTINGGGARDALLGGPGNDRCPDFESSEQIVRCGARTSAESPADPRPSQAYAFIDPRGPDPSLVVVGQGPNSTAGQIDDLSITAASGGYVVNATSPLVAESGGYGKDCQTQQNGDVLCPAPPASLGALTVFGDQGNDAIRIGAGFPSLMTADIEGGDGSDLLAGGDGEENFYTGPTGADVVRAGGGADALIAEGAGGDLLDAGPGNDQLVTDDPCQGHDYQGGGGYDIAGFGRYELGFQGHGVRAQLGGAATDPERKNCASTRIRSDIEILEGSAGPDQLYGDNRKNPLIIGREGDDVIHGMGGADTLSGDGGSDSLFGDGGFDTIEAQDGAKDRSISCGGGGGEALRDRRDPAGRGCRKLAKHKHKRK